MRHRWILRWGRRFQSEPGNARQLVERVPHRNGYVLFLCGQTISSMGTSFTVFTLPLLIYQLTGSPLNLALSTATNFLPYVLFGLLIGALVDRSNRKRLMIAADLSRALLLSSIPLIALLGGMHTRQAVVIWLYVVGFLTSTLAIGFNAGQQAAIPSLVGKDQLVQANGRIQASYSAATTIGPLLAGFLLLLVPLPTLMALDALSFLVSAATLARIRTSFNLDGRPARKPIGGEVLEGVRYVWGHPVLRNMALLLALVNLVITTTTAQLVLFARVHYAASTTQISLLYSASGLGVVVLSLLAGRLRAWWSFSQVALAALLVAGALLVALAWAPWYPVGLVLWSLIAGVKMLSTINTNSLRQLIVPNQLLSRVATVNTVLAWSMIPAGTLLGGLIIAWTNQITLVYGVIGLLIGAIALVFFLGTALGHAERYLPQGMSQHNNGTRAEQGAPAQAAINRVTVEKVASR